MGYEYKIDKSNNMLFIHFTDILDDRSLLGAFQEIYADPEYSPVMNQCINYSDVSELLISRFGIEGLATLCENFNCLGNRWSTYIIAPDDLAYGYARMYQILVDNSQEDVHIARSLEAALKLMAYSPANYPFSTTGLGQPC